jgi:tetratricopeptide (TPR) repeat protein
MIRLPPILVLLSLLLVHATGHADGVHVGLLSPDPAGQFPSGGGGPGLVPTVSAEEAAFLGQVRAIAPTNTTAAIALFAKRDLTAASPALAFTLANLHLQNHGYAEARDLYREVLRRHPTFRDAWANLGRALLILEQVEEAVPALQEALRLVPGDGATLLLLGGAYTLRGQAASAESAFRLALVARPEDDAARRGIARALLDQGRVEESLGWVREMLATSPHDASLWALRARAEAGLGRLDAACVTLLAARKLGLEGPGDALFLADLHLRSGRWAEAAAEYFTAARRPGVPAAELLRGVEALLRADRETDARLLHQLVPLADPAATPPSEQRARLRLEAEFARREGDADTARARLEDLVRIAPDDGPALLALGALHAAAGRIEEALLQYERASRLSGSEAVGWLRRAELEAARGRPRPAAAHAEAALAYDDRPEVRRYAEHLRRLADLAPR